jgi:hypothetical protein
MNPHEFDRLEASEENVMDGIQSGRIQVPLDPSPRLVPMCSLAAPRPSARLDFHRHNNPSFPIVIPRLSFPIIILAKHNSLVHTTSAPLRRPLDPSLLTLASHVVPPRPGSLPASPRRRRHRCCCGAPPRRRSPFDAAPTHRSQPQPQQANTSPSILLKAQAA